MEPSLARRVSIGHRPSTPESLRAYRQLQGAGRDAAARLPPIVPGFAPGLPGS